MRTSACVTFLFLLGLFASCISAQTFVGFDFGATMNVYGPGWTDLRPRVVQLLNPAVIDTDKSGKTHLAVSLKPNYNNTLVTVSPDPIVLNDANNFTAVVTITPTNSPPANWSAGDTSLGM